MAAPWSGKHGTIRVQKELKYLLQQISDGNLPHVSNLRIEGDDLMCWHFELKNFDEDVPGGAALNKDLQVLHEKHKQDHILMEARFPENYPTEPFFLRVISPRCVWYTGHVTAGGSICIESLTLSGTPGSWDPSFSFEAILNVVTTNMIDCESVLVQTQTGPGGLSGPLRVDLTHKYCSNVMYPYSLHEAKSAFQRTLRNHRQFGWAGGQGGGQGSTQPTRGIFGRLLNDIQQPKS